MILALGPFVGFDQKNSHHTYDVFTHTAHVVEASPADLTLRWAALLHDIGKPLCFTQDEAGQGHFLGHASISADLADEILLQRKAPTALRQQVCNLVRQHMTLVNPDVKAVRRALSRLGSSTFRQLLALQKADMSSKGTGKPSDTSHFDTLQTLASQIEAENACLQIKDLAVNGRDLMALGYEGPAIGKGLQQLLELVLDDQIENTKDALLSALQQGKR